MPRGRPRKNSFPLAESDEMPNALSEEGSAPIHRPARKRIAVRKFGCGSDGENSPATLACSPAKQQQEQQQKTDVSDGQQSNSGHILIHRRFWGDICSKLACSSCGKINVQMKTEKLSGLASKLIMYCTSCGVVLSQVTSSPESNDHAEELHYEVNRRFVKFFASEGKTYDDVVVFSKTLGIPVISKCMFERYRDELSEQMKPS